MLDDTASHLDQPFVEAPTGKESRRRSVRHIWQKILYGGCLNVYMLITTFVTLVSALSFQS